MRQSNFRLFLAGLLAGLSLLAIGCRPVTIPARTTDSSTDTWDLVLLQGKPIGISHTEVESGTPDSGKHVASWKQVTELNVARFGDSMRQKISVSSQEVVDGGFEAGTWQVQGAGDSGQSGTAEVTADGKSLLIKPADGSRMIRRPWQAERGGFFAVEQSLRTRPMRAGETRVVRGLLPLINQFATFTLIAGDIESVDLLGQDRKLRRIENEIGLALSLIHI